MRRALAAAVVLAALPACRDYDEALTLCAINRVCSDGKSGGFSLSASPSELRIRGEGFATSELTLTYPANFFEGLTLTLEGALDAGVIAAFNPQPVFAFSGPATLEVRAVSGAPAQMHALTVLGSLADGGERARTSVTVIIEPSSSTLVVDDDHSDNNYNRNNNGFPKPNPKPSDADLFYAAALTERGIAFDTWVQPDATWDGGDGPLTFAQVQKYASIVWYTNRSFQKFDNITAADDATLRAWLDQGNRKLILLSESYVGYQASQDWDMTNNPFVANYLGALGGVFEGSHSDGSPFIFRGVAGQPTANLVLTLPHDPVELNLSLINPKPGTQPLLTVRADPDSTVERDVAMATVRRNVGDAGTSTALYVGFALVDIAATDGGSREAAFKAFLDSAGF